MALDRNSRSSNVLARIILEKRYGLKPRYVTRDPSKGISFEKVDAALTIGDTSFRQVGIPFRDLGVEWKDFTGCPFVYALWAFLPGHPRSRELGFVVEVTQLARVPVCVLVHPAGKVGATTLSKFSVRPIIGWPTKRVKLRVTGPRLLLMFTGIVNNVPQGVLGGTV